MSDNQHNFAVWLLKNCDSYSFVADKRTGLFHNDSCVELAKINIADAQGCGKHPEKSGFAPCPKCMPLWVSEKSPAKSIKKKKSASPAAKTKADVIKNQLIKLGSIYGMHLEFIGTFVYVTTVAGEWYFDYCIRPIKLHHKNSEERFDSYGNPTGHYHVQKKQQFSSPAHALAYIYRHEKAIIKYLMGDGGNETYCPDSGNV